MLPEFGRRASPLCKPRCEPGGIDVVLNQTTAVHALSGLGQGAEGIGRLPPEQGDDAAGDRRLVPRADRFRYFG